MKNYSIKFPKDTKISGRTSTIRGSFIKAIIPTIVPTDQEVEEAMKILRQNQDELFCSYCGDKASEWEHFRPIVTDKSPTGYVTEIYNLVPSCGKCNQSKRSEYWKTWITGKAKFSPKSREIPDLDNKIKYLEEYELWSAKFVTKMPTSFLDSDKLKLYLESCEKLIETFKNYQLTAEEIKIELTKHTNTKE
jgi:hypothetical protein